MSGCISRSYPITLPSSLTTVVKGDTGDPGINGTSILFNTCATALPITAAGTISSYSTVAEAYSAGDVIDIEAVIEFASGATFTGDFSIYWGNTAISKATIDYLDIAVAPPGTNTDLPYITPIGSSIATRVIRLRARVLIKSTNSQLTTGETTIYGYPSEIINFASKSTTVNTAVASVIELIVSANTVTGTISCIYFMGTKLEI